MNVFQSFVSVCAIFYHYVIFEMITVLSTPQSLPPAAHFLPKPLKGENPCLGCSSLCSYNVVEKLYFIIQCVAFPAFLEQVFFIPNKGKASRRDTAGFWRWFKYPHSRSIPAPVFCCVFIYFFILISHSSTNLVIKPIPPCSPCHSWHLLVGLREGAACDFELFSLYLERIG